MQDYYFNPAGSPAQRAGGYVPYRNPAYDENFKYASPDELGIGSERFTAAQERAMYQGTQAGGMNWVRDEYGRFYPQAAFGDDPDYQKMRAEQGLMTSWDVVRMQLRRNERPSICSGADTPAASAKVGSTSQNAET